MSNLHESDGGGLREGVEEIKFLLRCANEQHPHVKKTKTWKECEPGSYSNSE